MLISIGEGKINYSDKGEGKVIVLLHGYLETLDVWESFSQRLASKFRVITVDLPGHGGSDARSSINTMEVFAETVRDLLDHLNTGKVFLTGHSMGGYATLAFAERFSDYLTGYSLFHSHPFRDLPAALEKRKENIGIVGKGLKDSMIPGFISNLYAPSGLERFGKEIARSVAIASTVDAETIIADLRGMMERPSRVHVIEEGRIPFLWILGEMDSHINASEMLGKVRLPPEAQAAILQNSGHMGFIEEEDISVKLLTEFVEKTVGQPPYQPA